jgi:hypothetical protein
MTTNNNQTPKTNKPAYIAYHVREGSGEKAFFTRIGATWPNADGKGFNITLDCTPVDGKITLRVNEEPPAAS